jgi:hypothetical protein
MNQLTPLNLLLLFCGLVINGLRAAQKAKENDTKFSFKFFVKEIGSHCFNNDYRVRFFGYGP